jgi:hypothetical protein
MKLVTVSQSPHAIYTSTNGGLAWMQQPNAPNASWVSVASSADGTKLVAVANPPKNIYTSTNSGLTWLTNNVSGNWNSVASSADGGNLVAECYGGGGGIYFSQSVSIPQLNITSLTNFVMQQSSDLTSWTNVTNTPTLNLTNLQNQVTLSPSNSSSFFRLSTP